MSDLLFDTPWWLLALLSAAGVGLLLSGNRRSHRPTLNAGAALLALAVVLAVLSWLVDTDREKVEKGSKALLAAVESQDWKTFQSLLQRDALLSLPGLPPLYHNAEQITEAAQEARQRAGLQSVTVRSLEVAPTPPQFTSTVTVLTLQDQAPPLISTWQFDWARAGDGWKVHEIRALRIGEIAAGSEMEHAFPRVH